MLAPSGINIGAIMMASCFLGGLISLFTRYRRYSLGLFLLGFSSFFIHSAGMYSR
jgi:hypothetical protein